MLAWLKKLADILGEILSFAVTNKNDSMTINVPAPVPTSPPEAPIVPVVPTLANPDVLVAWTTPVNVRHNVRVLCDLSGLSVEDKNILTACVARESGFDNNAKCYNRDATGAVWSTDWGIVQCNDWFHIGPGKDFPSVEYVLANQQVMVQWMIDCMKAGKLDMWSSYSTKAYLRYM